MENQYTSCQNEHNKLLKIINFRFQHRYKKIGIIGGALILGFLVIYKFTGGDSLLIKDVLRTIMLLFLLVASLSKDAIEDEYITHVRSQSYVIAFICAIGYSIALPLIAVLFDLLITRITGDGHVSFHEVSAFEVMFMLVCFQLLFFHTIKRFGRAE
ncbi:hypothetical protein [Portibacter lacus]|uniref:Uncharacterized protein n=1 Tax=Portibacter lacus TaxID=1099794 RepID=A0AA37SRH0_9BACT|nr:hypothetical protein [Portibacter lacus]GLR16520.1 hypothetical protein GCM10007940_11350 [Portibacter lacus]